MSSGPDDGIWFELRPNGHLGVGVKNPRRYRDQPTAEEAAKALRERFADFKFVEIVTYEERCGERTRARPVSRV
jgi:hypothetical protein